MALKPDRLDNIYEDISYFGNSTMERGGIVFATSTATGVGAAMDSAVQVAEYIVTGGSLIVPTGRRPLGVLMVDMVNIDQSRQKLNPYKAEVQAGDKVLILKKGWVVTNMIEPGSAVGLNCPVPVYACASGLFSTNGGLVASGFQSVGKLLTNKDGDGYAKVQIDL